jgi:hypothetical protein
MFPGTVYLILIQARGYVEGVCNPWLGFGTGLLWSWCAPKANFELLDEVFRAQWSASTRMQVNPFRRSVRIWLGQEMPPVGNQLQQWSYRNKPVILLVQVGRGARPAPVFNRLAEPHPQRVTLDVTDRCQQILLVHDEGVEAFLPQVSAPPVTEIDHPGVAAVCLGNRTAQSVLFARHQDDVHMVRHQAIGPNLRPAAFARGRHEELVLREVLVGEKPTDDDCHVA